MSVCDSNANPGVHGKVYETQWLYERSHIEGNQFTCESVGERSCYSMVTE